MNSLRTGVPAAVARGAVGTGVVLIAGLGLSAPASADQNIPIFMDTCNSDNQSGDACVFTTVIDAPKGAVLQFISSPDMCSDIIAHTIATDPQPHEIGVDRLSPGQAGAQRNILAGPGGNTGVSVHVNGLPGGCNTGGLLEWAGTLRVTERYDS